MTRSSYRILVGLLGLGILGCVVLSVLELRTVSGKGEFLRCDGRASTPNGERVWLRCGVQLEAIARGPILPVAGAGDGSLEDPLRLAVAPRDGELTALGEAGRATYGGRPRRRFAERYAARAEEPREHVGVLGPMYFQERAELREQGWHVARDARVLRPASRGPLFEIALVFGLLLAAILLLVVRLQRRWDARRLAWERPRGIEVEASGGRPVVF